MKIYLQQSVWDAAIERIEWVFSEFPVVVVGVSGGKDSTVLFHLALRVAQDLDRLPLPVLFLDQEAEWQATVEEIRTMMYHEDVKPYWLQVPMQISNATSQRTHWLQCWDPDAREDWVHPQDPIALTENIYGTKTFADLFTRFFAVHFSDTPAAYLSGVRTEESPTRMMALTEAETYKGETWGKILNRSRDHYTFYPLYDWSYSDIWKAIFTNEWSYNEIYKKLFMHGVPFKRMRVSNLHHETAVHSLFQLQKLEPETYERVVQRLPGADMAGKLGAEQFFVRNLPFVFNSWKEYRDYLVDHLLDEAYAKKFRKKFRTLDKLTRYLHNEETFIKSEVQSVLTNDFSFVRLGNTVRSPRNVAALQYIKGLRSYESIQKAEYRENINRAKFIREVGEGNDAREVLSSN